MALSEQEFGMQREAYIESTSAIKLSEELDGLLDNIDPNDPTTFDKLDRMQRVLAPIVGRGDVSGPELHTQLQEMERTMSASLNTLQTAREVQRATERINAVQNVLEYLEHPHAREQYKKEAQEVELEKPQTLIDVREAIEGAQLAVEDLLRGANDPEKQAYLSALLDILDTAHSRIPADDRQSASDFVASLQRQETALRQELDSGQAADATGQQRREKSLRQIEAALSILIGPDKIDSYSAEKVEKRWQEHKQHQASEQQRTMATQEVRKQLEEHDKKQELLDSISQDAGVTIHTSLPRSLHPTQHAGFVELSDNRSVEPGSHFFSQLNDLRFREAMTKQDVNEVVLITPATRDKYETIEEQVPVAASGIGGLFGRKATEVRQSQRYVGTEAVPHNALVANGKAEPSYRFVYYAAGNYNDSIDKGTAYQDHSLRSGQVCYVELTLPQSEAASLLQQIQQNPSYARRVVETAISKNLSIPSEAWEQGNNDTVVPLRPPYESWDRVKGGSKMVVRTIEAGQGLDMQINSAEIVQVKSSL